MTDYPNIPIYTKQDTRNTRCYTFYFVDVTTGIKCSFAEYGWSFNNALHNLYKALPHLETLDLIDGQVL